MNTGTTGSTSRGLRLALRVYPATYRAERGEEITAVHADLTEGAGRLATARETAGVAAYGLRVRTGLTSGGIGGQLLATTAPLVAAVALGQQLPVLWHLPQSWQTALPTADTPTNYRPEVIASAFPGVLWLLVVAALLLRKWTAARILAALAGVAVVAEWLVRSHLIQAWAPGMPPDYTDLVSTAGAGVLWALLVFAAPGDLLGSTVARRPRAAVLPALLLAASTLVHSAGVISASQNTTETLSATFLLLGLLSLAFLRWGRLLPTATGLAILPIVFTNAVLLLSYHVFSWFDYWLGDLGMLVNYVVGATLVALLTAGAVRFLYHQPSASPEASSDLSAQ